MTSHGVSVGLIMGLVVSYKPSTGTAVHRSTDSVVHHGHHWEEGCLVTNVFNTSILS